MKFPSYAKLTSAALVGKALTQESETQEIETQEIETQESATLFSAVIEYPYYEGLFDYSQGTIIEYEETIESYTHSNTNCEAESQHYSIDDEFTQT